jgi:hypothetical protein
MICRCRVCRLQEGKRPDEALGQRPVARPGCRVSIKGNRPPSCREAFWEGFSTARNRLTTNLPSSAGTSIPEFPSSQPLAERGSRSLGLGIRGRNSLLTAAKTTHGIFAGSGVGKMYSSDRWPNTVSRHHCDRLIGNGT